MTSALHPPPPRRAALSGASDIPLCVVATPTANSAGSATHVGRPRLSLWLQPSPLRSQRGWAVPVATPTGVPVVAAPRARRNGWTYCTSPSCTVPACCTRRHVSAVACPLQGRHHPAHVINGEQFEYRALTSFSPAGPSRQRRGRPPPPRRRRSRQRRPLGRRPPSRQWRGEPQSPARRVGPPGRGSEGGDGRSWDDDDGGSNSGGGGGSGQAHRRGGGGGGGCNNGGGTEEPTSPAVQSAGRRGATTGGPCGPSLPPPVAAVGAPIPSRVRIC